MKNVRKLFLFILLFCLSAVYTVFADETTEPKEIKVYVNNIELRFDQAPEIINDRTMVPMRTIFDALGYSVEWNDETKTVNAIKDEDKISLSIGSTSGFKNGELVEMDTPAVIKNSRTLVPLRWVSEAADCVVAWDGVTREIFINYDYLVLNKADRIDLSLEVDPLTLSDSVVMIDAEKMQGSGIIIGSNGYIATNCHVLMGSEKANIVFNDGSYYDGEITVVGCDVPRDIVIIKINKIGLKPVTFRDSTTIIEGEKVSTVSSPLGVFNSISNGYVKGFTQSVISTTAYITNGSSGGALFDESGNLIGMINSYNELEDYMSVPSNAITSVDAELNVPMTEWKTVEPILIPPENIEVAYVDDTVKVTWNSVLGADGYYVYISDRESGGYKKLKNTSTGKYLWKWNYPYSFSIIEASADVYLKITSVMDGKESNYSKVYHLDMK